MTPADTVDLLAPEVRNMLIKMCPALEEAVIVLIVAMPDALNMATNDTDELPHVLTIALAAAEAGPNRLPPHNTKSVN